MYTIIDFETTGLDHNEHQVTEIAAIKFSSKGKGLDTYHKFVELSDGRTLDSSIVELTGITEETLQIYGVEENTAMRGLKHFIGGSTVVAHFASFDLAFVHKYSIKPNFLCTRSIFQLMNPNEPASLKNCMEFYGMEYDKNAHRAMTDVVMTAQLFSALNTVCNIKDINVFEFLNVVTEREDRPLRFIPQGAKVIKL